MANPSVDYSSADGSGPYITLPGSYRFGGRPRSRQDENIDLSTDYGNRFVYNLNTRFVYELNFRLTPTQLDVFETFNDAVGGALNPFWFSLSGDGQSDAVYVRKEPGFDPRELDTPGNGDSVFDYTLYMIQDFSLLVASTTVNITF